MAETALSRQIRKAIETAYPQIRFWRNQCGMARGFRGGIIRLAEPGTPDYVGYLPDGRFFGLEIKDQCGHTFREREELQDSRLMDIARCGGVAIKASSVEEALSKIKTALGS